jgi:glycosyltransferase involved in cell wall biosynthesis
MPAPISPQSVVHVSHNYHIAGGSDRYFFELGKLLQQHQHSVFPFAAGSPENDSSEFATYFPDTFEPGAPTAKDVAKYIYSFDAKEKIAQLIQNHRPDIAHLHIYYGKLTASILAPLKNHGIPIVQTLHEYKLLCPVYNCISHDSICEECSGSRFWKCATKRCNRGSLTRSIISTAESYVSKWLGSSDAVDHFIAVSEFMARKMREIGVPAEKITTVYNFVDTEKFTPAKEHGSYVLYFGRLERTKGLITLLNAMKQVPDIKCKIAGDGSARQEIVDFITRNNMDNVELIEFTSGGALAELVHGSICTLIPSEWYENCPMSVLESLAWGRPIIGSRIGGIPELIRDDEDGLLVEPGDANGLAAAIERLGTDPALALRMGKSGRNKAEALFSAAQHYAQIRNVYDSLS